MTTMFRKLGRSERESVSEENTNNGASGESLQMGAESEPQPITWNGLPGGGTDPRSNLQASRKMEPTEEQASDSELHKILKNTDYGFNLDLSLLEKQAMEIARPMQMLDFRGRELLRIKNYHQK